MSFSRQWTDGRTTIYIVIMPAGHDYNPMERISGTTIQQPNKFPLSGSYTQRENLHCYYYDSYFRGKQIRILTWLRWRWGRYEKNEPLPKAQQDVPTYLHAILHAIVYLLWVHIYIELVCLMWLGFILCASLTNWTISIRNSLFRRTKLQLI